MQMDISPLFLKTFRKAYEVKNFTSTAQQLGMTQSGVSQHIAQLEAVLNVALFERVGRSVIPTKAAQKLYAAGGMWLAQMQDFVDEISHGEAELSGKVSLGTNASFGIFLLPYLVQWQRKHPGIQLEIEYGPRGIKEKGLSAGSMDLAISGDPFDSRYYESEEFYKQEFVLVSHPDLKPKASSFEEFSRLPMIEYSGAPSLFEKWSKAHYRKSCSMGQLNVHAKITNMESLFYLLEEKVGFTVFPSEPLLKLVKEKRLKIHSTDKTVLNSLYIVQRRGQVLSRRVEEMKQVILKTSNL